MIKDEKRAYAAEGRHGSGDEFGEPGDIYLDANILRQTLEASPTGVAIVASPSGKVLATNQALRDILGADLSCSKQIVSEQAGSAWGLSPDFIAFDEDGKSVPGDRHPLLRALNGGEESPLLECRYLRPDGAPIWIRISSASLRSKSGEMIGAALFVSDIDNLRSAQSQARLMKLELHHRVNNALAMVQSIANLGARSAVDLESFSQTFSGRVRSLSRTQLLLSQGSWGRIALNDLLDAELELSAAPLESRFALSGESGEGVMVPAGAAVALGLALHELKSNAEKFGALSVAGGYVQIRWRVDREARPPKLMLDWREIGGPPVPPPERQGLGVFLLESVLAAQLGGSIAIDFDAAGVVAQLVANI